MCVTLKAERRVRLSRDSFKLPVHSERVTEEQFIGNTKLHRGAGL